MGVFRETRNNDYDVISITAVLTKPVNGDGISIFPNSQTAFIKNLSKWVLVLTTAKQAGVPGLLPMSHI